MTVIDISSSDIDEDNEKAWAEVSLEINIMQHLNDYLMAHSGFKNGITKSAKFNNIVIEFDETDLKVWFQVEQAPEY